VKVLQGFLDRLARKNIAVDTSAPVGLAPAHLLTLAATDWGRFGAEAALSGWRWAAVWGEDGETEFRVQAAFEKSGSYFIARTAVPAAAPVIASHTPYFPAADRMERHLRDMFGVDFADHPDARRWTRHQAWKENQHPLRKSFAAGTAPSTLTAPDDTYKFLFAQGNGVYEIPVGPVHAGIIEPGHFRFQAVGERVLNLEERLGYVHKGIEKIAEGRDAAGLARLAGRVSGDSTVAHAWAACRAMESAAALGVPPRALVLRALMAERERVANHLGDIGAICNDVSFTFSFYQFGRLRELWQRLSQSAFGHRFMMDRIVPGGVTVDLTTAAADAMIAEAGLLRQELPALYDIIDDLPSLEDRLDTTGYLAPETARAFGALGYVGRASNLPFDVRKDAPYPPYDRLNVTVPVLREGDVAARVTVRAREILASFDLIEWLIGSLPEGDIAVPWPEPAAGAEGLGLVEGFRGECLAYVRFGTEGRIARYFPRDPSWLTWPTLEKLVRDNIVPDFPVCNKSVNGSYSGHDL
jgi:Ni,Fe-hydrogenase III large subunit/NADH:ubiquinone oxidoreductase subunit C